jgi:hypothetical protein
MVIKEKLRPASEWMFFVRDWRKSERRAWAREREEICVCSSPLQGRAPIASCPEFSNFPPPSPEVTGNNCFPMFGKPCEMIIIAFPSFRARCRSEASSCAWG